MAVETLAGLVLDVRPALFDAAKLLLSGKPTPAAPPEEQIRALVSQFRETREKYLEARPNPHEALEKRRLELLQQITICQNRILFEVTDMALAARLVPFAIEQTTNLYSAATEVEFALVEMNIGQMEALLERNVENLRSRARHRALAVIVSLSVVALVAALVATSGYFGLTTATVLPILQVPLPVIVWSGLGSFGAMLYRFNYQADAELADPLRWSFTRPLTGVLMGIIAYMVFKVGLVVLQPGAAHGPSAMTQEVLWLAAFLAGFSDRFADSVLRSLAGRLGGDGKGPLMTDNRSPLPDLSAAGGTAPKPQPAKTKPCPDKQSAANAPAPPGVSLTTLELH